MLLYGFIIIFSSIKCVMDVLFDIKFMNNFPMFYIYESYLKILLRYFSKMRKDLIESYKLASKGFFTETRFINVIE